jgi:hypothetical protein
MVTRKWAWIQVREGAAHDRQHCWRGSTEQESKESDRSRRRTAELCQCIVQVDYSAWPLAARCRSMAQRRYGRSSICVDHLPGFPIVRICWHVFWKMQMYAKFVKQIMSIFAYIGKVASETPQSERSAVEHTKELSDVVGFLPYSLKLFRRNLFVRR